MKNHHSLHIETFPIGSYACNCSLVYSSDTKECIVIDPGNDFQTLFKIIEDKGLVVKQLLHTHAHFDHIGESSLLADKTGASIHLHRGDQFLYEALAQQGQFFGQELPDPAEVDGWLENEETFSLDDGQLKEFLRTFHTPGHTPGSCCFYTENLEKPLLFAGDTLFSGSIGRTDLPGGDGDLIISSIKKRLLTLPAETQVITGHGPSTSILKEKKSNPFLV